MARVVVAGGGLAGSAVAARLAKLGHEVTLCERSGRLGGSIGFVEADGFRWDSGPATTTLPAVLRDLFRKSGRPLERELELVPVDPVRRHRFEDGTELDMHAGSRARQLDAMTEALGAESAQRWMEYVDGLAPLWAALRTRVLEHPFGGCDALDTETRRLLDTGRSLRRVARRTFPDARLRTLLEHPTELAGSDPRNTPGLVAVEAFVERTFGRCRPAGGMGALAEVLAARLDERGVEVLLGHEVVEIDCDHAGRRNVVTADGTAIPADVVVAAGIDPRRLMRCLVNAPRAARMARRIRGTTPAFPPAVTHLGLTSRVPDLPAELVLHGDPTLVVRTTDDAPDGHRAWTVVRRGDAEEDVLSTMTRRGLDVRLEVVSRVDRAPSDIVTELNGSPYGVSWDGTGTVSRRLPNETPVPGLYCVGASAHPGAGVPLAGLGAALVAQLIGKA
ncbi:MAG: FAD-dependent oxidoreductase [Propionibacteriales bacterium]|nr:FAD-dependent oxidoreductase [Propionibacteriales bacterium]